MENLTIKQDVGTEKLRNYFIRIGSELKYAVGKSKKEDLIIVFLACLSLAVKGTVKAKLNILRDAGVFLAKVGIKISDKLDEYRECGLLAIKKDVANIIKSLGDIPSNLKNGIMDVYRGLSGLAGPERKKVIIETAIMAITVVFFAKIVAGGFDRDFEGGIPDLDLKTGIGNHRHWLTHSIFAGFTIEIIIRTTIYLMSQMHDYLPEEHHPVWDRVKEYTAKYGGYAIKGTWLGVAVHLFIDSEMLEGFSSSTKSVVGLPPMNGAGHKIFLASNAALSTVFAAGIPVKGVK